MSLRRVGRLLDLLRLDHRWQRLKFALRVCLQPATLYPLDIYAHFDADLCAGMFLRNQAMLHSYGASRGTRVLTYLQPFNGVGSRPLTHVDVRGLAHLRRRVSGDGTTELDAMHAVYGRLAAEFARRADVAYVDLTTIFDATRRQIYIDQVHCSDVGYDLMARQIAADILAAEGVAGKAETP